VVGVAPRPAATQVTVSGEVDLATIAQFRGRVDTLPDRDTAVEMSELALLCAAGIRVLLDLQGRLTAEGARGVVAAASRLVRRVLAVTGLDGWLLMAPTVDDALTLLGVRQVVQQAVSVSGRGRVLADRDGRRER